MVSHAPILRVSCFVRAASDAKPLNAARVTVRIEEEDAAQTADEEADSAIDLLFGMWRDRKDMADVEGYIRKLRAPRYNSDGSRNHS